MSRFGKFRNRQHEPCPQLGPPMKDYVRKVVCGPRASPNQVVRQNCMGCDRAFEGLRDDMRVDLVDA